MERSTTPAATCCLRPATRTMKNSARFELTIDRNFTRSRRGFWSSWASSSTRRKNARRLSSRLRYRTASRGTVGTVRCAGGPAVSAALPCRVVRSLFRLGIYAPRGHPVTSRRSEGPHGLARGTSPPRLLSTGGSTAHTLGAQGPVYWRTAHYSRVQDRREGGKPPRARITPLDAL